MTDGTTVYRAGWRDGLRPDPRLTVSEWADQYRELSQQSSSEAWHWSTDRTPYLREVMDALSPSSPVETVVLQKGSQLGGTEAGNNWLGYVIHQAPGPMLYVQPTVEMVKRTSKQRIAHMIESCGPLRERVKETRSRDSGNTILAKEFPGGILVMTGANSAVGLRSIPVRYLFMDEIDAFEADVEGEGDPVELARRRTSNFRRNRKILLVSTPTLKGFSRIERAFLQTDQRYYQVPCPFCGVLQRITWAAIQWPDGEPQKAAMKCAACERLIPESRKTEMLAGGEWIPTAEGNGRTVGYHLSALYSPLGWYSWGDAAADHMKAKEAGREALKVWINTVLAETWEEEGDAIDGNALVARVEEYPERVPQGVLVLTCGVDVQDNRVELEVVGWGMGEESWGIDYRVIRGDPGRKELWADIDDALRSTYPHQDGYPLRIAATCIDSGGHYTQQVYTFCQGKQVRRIFAIKGFAGAGRPVVAAPKKSRTGRDQRHVELFQIGADQARGIVHSRLRIERPGPGHCHWPADGWGYDEEYFSQLSSMKAVVRYSHGVPRREWVLTPHRRKEAFDCRIYSLAALYILNPAWEALRKKADRAALSSIAEKNHEVSKDSPPKQGGNARALTRPAPRRGRGWVTGWR